MIDILDMLIIITLNNVITDYMYTPFHLPFELLSDLEFLVWAVQSKRGWCYMYLPDKSLFNPLIPGTFCKKCVFWTFWCFLSWISAKLALIWSKMHLQLNSFPFLPPASHFTTLWLGYAQKSKFWTRKWPMSLGFSIFGIFFSPSSFLLFFSVCCSDWPSTGLACS